MTRRKKTPRREPKNNAKDLNARIDARIEQLAKLTDDAAISDTMRDFLKTLSKFHRYSMGNQLLIAFFAPHATRVAGFHTWLSLNRYVRRGEQGIPILAPCIYKVNPDDDGSPRELRGFRVVYVFDISQTEGEPLPPPPTWTSPGRLQELETRLIDFAAAREIIVKVEELAGETQGLSRGGEIILSPSAGTKTLIHEIAHEMMHKDHAPLDRETRELEAEAVAFVVATHFGIPNLASPNYLALWCADSESIRQRMDRIRATAAEIISAIEPQEASDNGRQPNP